MSVTVLGKPEGPEATLLNLHSHPQMSPAVPEATNIDNRYLRLHPELFQKAILLACIKSFKFYEKMRTRLCPYEEYRRSRRPDFAKLSFNLVYGLAADYWDQWSGQLDQTQDYGMSLEDLNAALASEITQGRISQGDAQTIWEMLEQDMPLFDFGPGVLQNLPNNPALNTWLDKRAAANIVDFVKSTSLLKPRTLAELKQLIVETELAMNAGSDIAPTPLGNLPRAGPDFKKHLVGNRWLYRGGSLMFIGPTGTGKSSFAIQLGIHWAVGKPSFGLKPTVPLRVLYVQAENDAEDVAEVRDDVYKGIGFPAADQELANRNFKVLQKVDATGDKFVAWLAGVLDSYPCDVLIIDPLMAYIGGDVTQQAVTSKFLREGLQPLITKHNVGVIVVHHPPKPKVDNPKETAQSDSYFGAGSHDIANWVRGVMVLRPTKHLGLFKLRLPKRGKRVGWMEADGITPKIELDVAHGRNRLIYWREADTNEGFIPKKADTTRADILALIPPSGQIWQERVVELASEKPIGRNKVLNTLKLLEADNQIRTVKIPRDGCRPSIAYTREPV